MMSEEKATEAAPAANDDIKTIAALKSEAAERRIENTKLTEQLAEIQRAQKEGSDKKLEENEEFKTLAEQRGTELADALKRLEERDTTLQGYQDRDEEKFKTLLESVPDDMKELVNDDTLPLSKRLALAERFANQKPGAPGPKPAGGTTANTITRADFEAKNPTERMAFIQGGGKVT